jgi:hypothetical protein
MRKLAEMVRPEDRAVVYATAGASFIEEAHTLIGDAATSIESARKQVKGNRELADRLENIATELDRIADELNDAILKGESIAEREESDARELARQLADDRRERGE